jgi:hypothetical protein
MLSLNQCYSPRLFGTKLKIFRHLTTKCVYLCVGFGWSLATKMEALFSQAEVEL